MFKKPMLLLLVTVIPIGIMAADTAGTAKSPTQEVKEQPPAAPAPPSLTLEQVVWESLSKNPAVQSALHTVEAQRAKVPQAGSLPDPTVSVGWAGNIEPFSVQTGDPSSYRGVTAMQMLPLFGKRGLRRDVAAKEADASQWDVEAVRRRIVAEIAAAFYDYWYYDKAIRTTKENRNIVTGKQIGRASCRERV